jgi:hypothetical protein
VSPPTLNHRAAMRQICSVDVTTLRPGSCPFVAHNFERAVSGGPPDGAIGLIPLKRMSRNLELYSSIWSDSAGSLITVS